MLPNCISSHVLMVRPAAFGYNMQTAASNRFQSRPDNTDGLNEKAVAEFDNMVELLTAKGIKVTVVQDDAQYNLPDAVFPNNWFSILPQPKILFLYPMAAENRRAERRTEIIEVIKATTGITEISDLTGFETNGAFLEGTGSLVLDHANRMAYACLSQRTNLCLLGIWSALSSYEVFAFEAADATGNEIYHTNVLMHMGPGYACICLQAVAESHKAKLVETLNRSGKEVIDISFEQMDHFAGNMLHLQNQQGQQFIILSRSALDALDAGQKEQLSKYGDLLPVSVPVIETTGGGSVRCMMAELF